MRSSLLQIDMLQTLQPFLLNLSIYALNSMLLFVSSHVRRYFSGVHSVHSGSHISFFVLFFFSGWLEVLPGWAVVSFRLAGICAWLARVSLWLDAFFS